MSARIRGGALRVEAELIELASALLKDFSPRWLGQSIWTCTLTFGTHAETDEAEFYFGLKIRNQYEISR